MKNRFFGFAVLTVFITALSMSANSAFAEGAAEHAGKHLDGTPTSLEDSAHKVKENAKSAAKDVKNDAEGTGKDIENNAEKVAENARSAAKQVGRDTKENAKAVEDSAEGVADNAASVVRSAKEALVGTPGVAGSDR
jgi:predicted small secreted protein